ncbi:MAG: formylglycine-generating enzyme family protein [Planctomycetaceae bacterium]
MSLSGRGRADLVRALAQGVEFRDELAGLLGFKFEPNDDEPAPQGQSGIPNSNAASSSSTPGKEAHESKFQRVLFQPAPVAFWQPVRCRLLDAGEGEPTGDQTVERVANCATGDDLPERRQREVFKTLAPLTDLLSRFRGLTELEVPGSRPDIPQLVDDISRGRLRSQIPRLPRRGFGGGLHVIEDRSPHLTPYDNDQGILALELRDLLPKTALTISTVSHGNLKPEIHWPIEVVGPLGDPEPNSVVLVMSDLGVLNREPDLLIQAWREYGEWLTARHARCVALVPCGVEAIPESLSRLWTVLPWHGADRPEGGLEHSQREVLATRLLALLSFAVTIEPQLLRMVRCAVPDLRPFPELESLVWQHATLMGAGREGIAISQTDRDWLDQFRQAQPLAEKMAAIEYTISDHASHFVGLRNVEVLNLGREYFSDEQIVAARRWFQAIDTDEAANDAVLHDRIEFFRLAAPHCTSAAFRRYPELRRLWSRHLAAQRPLHYQIQLQQAEKNFQFRRRDGENQAKLTSQASPITEIHSRHGRINFVTDVRQPDFDFWDGEPPGWAADWGIDEDGLWVELWVSQVMVSSVGILDELPDTYVKQRLRWIPNGSFLMGSPGDEPYREPGRFDDEGPQHVVSITDGFWLFDTPVTQAFYQAVTGENPSYFKSSNRPVEQVSWKDAQKFLEQLNGVIPGLNACLPTEAEWEYACRAGTSEALYTGPIEIIGDNNAPALAPIAWYGGNCGVEFDLDEGSPTSVREKQYEFDQGGTHEVAQKQANPWGLYDMLGNVCEWCDDGKRNYAEGTKQDPRGPSEASAHRVFRGGSWVSHARYVRAACRLWYSPEGRYSYLGFRCRVRGAEPSQGAAEQAKQARKQARAGKGGSPERAVSGRSGKAEPRGDSSPASGERRTASGPAIEQATWIQLIDRQEASVPVPAGPVAKIVSDVEELTLRRIPRPGWASAIGRDEFGLWADLKVEGKAATEKGRSTSKRIDPKLAVKLRWIPPGRFMMGSPKGEPGRWDGEFEPHLVEVPSGFWLFETPVTQALWEWVMGNDSNKSKFRSADRPVESVSWHDCRTFCSALSDVVNSSDTARLEVALPSEAEWEYACRAGTSEATYAGSIEILGDANAPVLDDISWYGGNSNVAFELENGQDASDWLNNRQHGDKGGKSGTHRVKEKAPNPWGLYDMLGNVYEWCSDVGRMPGESVPDQFDEASAYRVIRGGSWRSSAQGVRAAFRVWYSPGSRDSSLGFRCRVREFKGREESSDSASAERSQPVAEPGGDSGAAS